MHVTIVLISLGTRFMHIGLMFTMIIMHVLPLLVTSMVIVLGCMMVLQVLVYH